MITAQNEWHLPGFQSLHDQFGLLAASSSNLSQVLGVRIAFFLLFSNGNRDIPGVFHYVSQGFQPRFEPRNSDRRRPPVHTSTRLAKVEGNTDDANLLGSNAGSACARKGHIYGYSRCSVRANGIVSRTCSNPQIHATARSIPIPKPPCGTPPNFRRSRYHLNASSGKPCSRIRCNNRS